MESYEVYTVHCTVCGNIETDKDDKEIHFSDNWRDHVRECSYCGALEITSIKLWEKVFSLSYMNLMKTERRGNHE
jgi:hypothetical protein